MLVNDFANWRLPGMRSYEIAVRVADEDVDTIGRDTLYRQAIGSLELVSNCGCGVADFLLGQAQITQGPQDVGLDDGNEWYRRPTPPGRGAMPLSLS
jgi:hypothetical protein